MLPGDSGGGVWDRVGGRAWGPGSGARRGPHRPRGGARVSFVGNWGGSVIVITGAPAGRTDLGEQFWAPLRVPTVMGAGKRVDEPASFILLSETHQNEHTTTRGGLRFLHVLCGCMSQGSWVRPSGGRTTGWEGGLPGVRPAARVPA